MTRTTLSNNKSFKWRDVTRMILWAEVFIAKEKRGYIGSKKYPLQRATDLASWKIVFTKSYHKIVTLYKCVPPIHTLFYEQSVYPICPWTTDGIVFLKSVWHWYSFNSISTSIDVHSFQHYATKTSMTYGRSMVFVAWLIHLLSPINVLIKSGVKHP